MPLFDEHKRRVGVLASHLNLDRIDRLILERTGLGASGETYLVNTSNVFVSAEAFAPARQLAGAIKPIEFRRLLGKMQALLDKQGKS